MTKKNKAFTLIETVVVIMLFIFAIVIIAQLYISLTKAALDLQQRHIAINSIHSGLEKIYSELKNGFSFTITDNSILFKDKLCETAMINFDSNRLLLYYNSSSLFNKDFVELEDVKIYGYNPSTTPSASYYYQHSSSTKLIVIDYYFYIKSPITTKTPLFIRQSIAPLNSSKAQIVNRCKFE
ncbi:MAG: hypothetical protein KatS3mg097_268 [Candidatus Parcubacteria bacterium]|nr:MAG: hypothetical protein KatS3mg097_268 [Candidatus Parcubacteria bacterium]